MITVSILSREIKDMQETLLKNLEANLRNHLNNIIKEEIEIIAKKLDFKVSETRMGNVEIKICLNEK